LRKESKDAVETRISDPVPGTNIEMENKMNTFRSFFIKSSLMLVAALLFVLAAFRLYQPDVSLAKENAAPIIVYDATGAMLESVVQSWEIPAASRNMGYDATTTMRKSVVYSWEVQPAPAARPVIVYDATGAMLKAVVFP
jgi:hypothetical protein